jgi:serine/threonine-protein kinase
MDDGGAVTPSLGERYACADELGRGAMAVVYRALDRETGRRVAVKVLKRVYARVLGVERFLREIAVLSALRHPGIVPLLDSGQADGLPFYVMPLADGGSLRDRLRREPQLPLPEVVRIATAVAAALDAAHAVRVVHRDIKPENVLFDAGHPLVCDFGVARAVTIAGGDSLSSAGLAVGTPAYMSPEQAAGDREVDGRADLYALGCVLYEMLTGQPPFTGATAQAVFARHAAERPPSPRVLRPDVPAGMERAIAASLAKAPADRPSNGAALVAQLRS